MKLVYVIEKMSGIGGMERILTDKMNWLCRQDYIELTLLLVWKDAQPIEFALDPRIHIERLEIPYIKGGLTYPLALYRYNKTIKRLQPDITVFCWVMGAFLAAYGHHVGKTIFESHLAATRMRHRWLIDKMQQKVNKVVTLTSQDACNFTQAFSVSVIPNFTMLEIHRKPSYEVKHCVALGRFVHQKNYPRMIAIWRQVVQRFPEWTLDIYGDGEDRAVIEQCIQRAHIQDNVILHGYTKEVVNAYTSGSIYLMTSRMEGFPLVLIEAMACGLPVVAFDCPYGPRDAIKNGVTGYLIPYDDDKAYIEALSQLMGNVSLRKQMGTAATAEIGCYSYESIMQQWLSLFQEIVLSC